MTGSKNSSATIMAHLVAYYPNETVSKEAGAALIDGGASYIEIQFPFSDPTADGPVIQNACSKALNAGFTPAKGFKLAEAFSIAYGAPVFVMAYGNTAFTLGIERFVRTAKDSGVKGLIVPDLCPPLDEGLFEAAEKHGVHVLPVAAPGMSDRRIALLKALNPFYLYAALRKGVTGRETGMEGAIDFINRFKEMDVRIFAGFGIKTREQVLALTGRVYGVVVGSLFVETIDACLAAGRRDVSIDLWKKMSYLCKGDG